MPLIMVAKEQLHYRLEGPAHAPIVLFANSLGTTLDMWDDQLAAFTLRFRVLRYDMRGHGGSSLAADPVDLERLGQDALALLDALQLTHVNFCGLSLGGAVGLWLGAHAPQRLRKLVLCNTAASFGSRSLWDARIAAVQQSGMEAIASSVIERWFSPDFRERQPATVARLRRMLLSLQPQGYVPACAAARDADQRASASRVRAPCLVIGGTHDRATPPSEGRWLAGQIRGARYVELPAAHLSNVEAPTAFNESVLEFIAGKESDNG